MSRRGQVFFEYAISIIGFVMLLAITLRVWVWLNSMVVLRQGEFQASRVRAGTRDTAGEFVDYQPLRDTPLRLTLIDADGGLIVGKPDSLVDGGDARSVPPPAERCKAGRPFFDRAEQLRGEARDLQDQANALPIAGMCDDVPTGGDLPLECQPPALREYNDIVNNLLPNAEQERDAAQRELDRIDARIQELRDLIEDNPDPALLDELDDLENVQRPYWQAEYTRWQDEVDWLIAREEEIGRTSDADFREWARLNGEARAKEEEAWDQTCLGLEACGESCGEDGS